MMEENVLFLKTETKVLTVLQYVQCLKSTMLLYSSPVRPSILFIKTKCKINNIPQEQGLYAPGKPGILNLSQENTRKLRN